VEESFDILKFQSLTHVPFKAHFRKIPVILVMPFLFMSFWKDSQPLPDSNRAFVLIVNLQ
jgi:hypothetical protein